MNRILVLASVAFFPLISFARDLAVGDSVFVSLDAVLALDGTPAATAVDVKTIRWPAEIVQKIGNRFVLERDSGTGKTIRVRVHKTDLLQTDEALSYITEQLQKQANDPYLWLYRGLVWREKNKPVDAINDFTAAIKLDPTFAEAYLQRGLITRRCKIDRKLNTAFQDFSEVIRLLPNDPLAYGWRAYNWDERGDIDKAINDYSTAIKLGDQEGSTFFYRGYYHQVKGEYDLALVDFDEGIRLSPERSDFFQGIAWFRATFPDERYRDGKVAVQYATQSQKLGYVQPWQPLDALAAAYAESGDFPNAVEWAEKALKSVPKHEADYDPIQKRLELYRAGKPYRDPTFYVDVAWRRATSPVDGYRDGKVAISFATKACELTEWNDWKSLGALAAAYAESGDLTKAVELGEKSLGLAPEARRQKPTQRLELYRSNKPFRDGPQNE